MDRYWKRCTVVAPKLSFSCMWLCTEYAEASQKEMLHNFVKDISRNGGDLFWELAKKIPSRKSLSDKYKDVFVFRLMCENSRMPCFGFFFTSQTHFHLCGSLLKNYNPFRSLISKLQVSSSPCILLSDIISAPTYTVTVFSFAQTCRAQCRWSGSDNKLNTKVASSATPSMMALGIFFIPNLLLFILIAHINQLTVLG